MNSQPFFFRDAARSRLRATVTTIERRTLSLPKQVTDDDTKESTDGRDPSWAHLVEQLALGLEPEVRKCPVCKRIGVRAATFSGYCWTKLTPRTGRDGVVR